MAVSMSAGGSGYMRSDYMISDAAIPLRVEESIRQEENSAQFSKVLNDIGEAKISVGQAVSVEDNNIPTDVPQDFHSLVEAVANGEIKPEDIPKEFLSQNMLEELARLVSQAKAPAAEEDVSDISKDPAVQELMAELAAMFPTQQPIVSADDMSEEISSLTVQPEVKAVQTAEIKQPEVKAVQTVEIKQPEQLAKPVETVEAGQEVQFAQQPEEVAEAPAVQLPEAALEVPQEAVEHPENTAEITVGPAENVAVSEISEASSYAEPTVNTVTTEKVVTQEKTVQTVEPVPYENTVQSAEVRQITPRQSSNDGQQNDTPSDNRQDSEAVLSAKAAPKEQTEAVSRKPADFSGDISRAEVRKETDAVQPEQAEQQEQRVIPQHHAQRSRVVSKSDELQMIKGTADVKPAEENAAQTLAQPQTVTAEKPVIFARADGSEVEVKPSDVAQQVAEKLTEHTSELDDGSVEYRVTLNPEELGRITVRMTKTADGTVSVSIAAENSRTLKIIEDNGTAIQNNLKQNGVQLESWQIVGESKHETHAEDYQGSSRNPYRENNDRRQDQESDGESFADIIASM